MRRWLRYVWRRVLWAFRLAFVFAMAGLAPWAPPPKYDPPPPMEADGDSGDDEGQK